MIALLKNIFAQYRTILKNSFFLTVVHGVKLLLPFVAMPYIIRVCGVENYGKIILAQTVIIYFVAFVNLGVTIVAPKEVANNLHSLQKISKITSALMMIRLAFAFIGIAFLFLIVCFVPQLQSIAMLLVFAYVTVFAEALSPHVIFQGIEKMHNITLINICAVAFYIFPLFLFVKDASDYVWVPLFQSLATLISVLVGIIFLQIKYHISMFMFSLNSTVDMIKKSSVFMVSWIAANLNTNIFRLLAGLALGVQELAVLDIAQKITETASIPANIVEQAIFPFNARKKDKLIARQMFWIMLIFSCACAGVVMLGTPFAVRFLGAGELNAAIPITCYLSIKVVLAGLNSYLGIPLLVAFGYPEPYNRSIILSSALMLLVCIMLLFFNILSLSMLVVLIIVCEIVIFVARLYYCRKFINVP